MSRIQRFTGRQSRPSSLCIGDSSTSSMVAGLQGKGLVTRTRSSEDQRVVLVALTDEGRALVGGMSLGGIPLLRESLKTLAPERLEAVRDALVTMMDLLEVCDGC
jgi:DNA-binding MarR family transcriptional regulator